MFARSNCSVIPYPFTFYLCSYLFWFLDIDECATETHDCDVNARCVNEMGQYKCVCKRDYRGNGFKGNCQSKCHGLLSLGPCSNGRSTACSDVFFLSAWFFASLDCLKVVCEVCHLIVCVCVCVCECECVCVCVCLSVCISLCLCVITRTLTHTRIH